MRVRVLHIITSLGEGGAEGALTRLLTHSNKEKFDFVVVNLGKRGKYNDAIEGLGLKVINLGINPSIFGLVKGLRKLKAELQSWQPHIIQTWMYHADFFGVCVGYLYSDNRPKLVWGVRNSTLDRQSSLSSKVLNRVNSLLSYCYPDKVVSCAESAVNVHIGYGYSKSKFMVIHNGFDVDKFKPLNRSKDKGKDRLHSIDSRTIKFISVGRFSPQKSYPKLLQSFSELVKVYPNSQLTLVGSNVDYTNSTLTSLIDSYNLNNNVVLLGSVNDTSLIFPDYDFNILASDYGEAFPNVVAESMSCGLINIVTDVGDSSLIVNGTGFVAAPYSVKDLTLQLMRACELENHELKVLREQSRKRIVDSFSISNYVVSFSNLYMSLLDE